MGFRDAIARIPAPLRAAGLYAGGIAVAKAVSFMLIPVMTHALSPESFGRLELLSSVGEVAGMFAGAGLLEVLFRFAIGERRERMAADVTGLAISVSALFALLAMALCGPISRAMPLPTRPYEVLMIGLAVAVEAAISVPLGWLRVNDRAVAYTAVTLARALVQAALVAFLVIHGQGVAGVLCGGAAVAAASALGLIYLQSRSTGIGMHPARWGGLLAFGLPMIGSGLAAFALGSADRWVLAPNVGASMLGLYGLACKFGMVAAICTQPFELWWYPRRIALAKDPGGAAAVARTVDRLATYYMLSAAACAVAGPPLLIALTPVAYHQAATFVPWLCLAFCIQQMCGLFNIGCYMGLTGTKPLAVSTVAAVVALGGYFAIVPPLGVDGAIVATVLGQTVRLGLFHHISNRTFPVPHRYWTLAGLAVACAAGGGVPALAGYSWVGAGAAAAWLSIVAAVAAYAFLSDKGKPEPCPA